MSYKGKPVARRGRKASGLDPARPDQDGGAAEVKPVCGCVVALIQPTF